jgi:peptidoglycan/xylan/chitin deacetylase (PgdA/CDA1 family)
MPSAGFKTLCRRGLASVLYRTGLLSPLRRMEGKYELGMVPGSGLPRVSRFTASKFGILCYHRVGTEGVPLYSRLAPGIFEAQMRYLSKHYRLVPLRQLCRELQEARTFGPTLAITFDDGYRDLYTHAFPVLRRYKIPATIYLIGRCMETGEAPWYDRIFAALASATEPVWEAELGALRHFVLGDAASRAAIAWETICYLRSISDVQRRKWCAAFDESARPPQEELASRMLDWDQVRAMHSAGVSFGAHTMTHPAVSRLEPSAFQEELLQSRRLLESGLGAPIEDFAYPFGKPADRSDAVEDYLEKNGYRSAVTTTEGFNTMGVNRFRLRRFQIGDDRSLPSFALGISRMFLERPGDSPQIHPLPANRMTETMAAEADSKAT